MIREQPHYRHDAFLQGLKAAGYQVQSDGPISARAEPSDVLVIWNRYGAPEEIAGRWEAKGGIVLVAENGYVRGPHDGGDYYAIARHAHNGRGQWHHGGPERWTALDTEIKPWRRTGTHILVALNRTFGMRGGSAMPPTWPNDVVKRLRAMTKREVRVRQHPGTDHRVPLDKDLDNAWAVVIWSSSVGVKALIAGIPVICEAPYWICKSAGMPMPKDSIEVIDSFKDDVARRAALERMAWAQWSVSEISTGQPFHRLLQREAEPA